MAFICKEDFDSYSTSSDLNLQAGGTGWPSGWGTVAAKWSIQAAPGGGQGGNAAKNTTQTVSPAHMARDLSSITAGTISFRIQISVTNPNDFLGVVLAETGGTNRMYVRFGPTGNIELYDHGTTSYVSVAAYSANTWYTIDIDFDKAAQPNLYRVRVNGGSYSAYKTVDGGSYSDIVNFKMDASATGTRDFWIDDIRPGGVVLPRSVFRNQAVHRAAYW